MQTDNILFKNFLYIIRSGAFDDSRPISMMSPFKWGKMVQLAQLHGLIPILAKGLEHYFYDVNFNIPPSQIEDIRERLKSNPIKGFNELYDFDHLRLQNKTLNQRLQQIIKAEYADIERSFETMQTLAILLVNVEHILTGKSYLKGIIDLGRYLRVEGSKVDFVKLENWLKSTEMTKMGDYQCRLLISGFGFSKEEFPFMQKNPGDDLEAVLLAVSPDSLKQFKPWDFHESKGGFVIGSPLRTLRSIRHTLTYRRYAPREAFSTIYQGFLKGLSEIEE